jgi:hypothetical protein
VEGIQKFKPKSTVKFGGIIMKEKNNRYSVDMFIVPNSSITIEKMLLRKQYEGWLSRLMEVNGLELSNNECLIDVWMVSNSTTGDTNLESDNLRDHGFEVDGKRACIGSAYFPKRLIESKKEGDVIEINLPITYPEYQRDENTGKLINCSEDDVIAISLKLNQKDYRYRRFGNFEEVLEKVS